MKTLLTLTEAGMLLYWALALAALAGWQIIPPDQMYSDYEDPLIIAWNWSFFPLDVTFAVLGLTGRFAISDPARKAQVGLVALTLMFCAGLMALSFWSIRLWFDPLWWGLNLWLVILPVFAVFSGQSGWEKQRS
ncbi:YvaD family protein [Ruegeria sp. 2012CJ41-6]|uniref:YvaD family protein n=1 Tax=Ruegeria spongiae TaxID=2942209 RepID=A0ABT0PZD0_9RHOB|nr:DUF5360 family protein [Ruegeria spongiae]MCL6282984.1 YvaD family protein [Ruegeria spongiae]